MKTYQVTMNLGMALLAVILICNGHPWWALLFILVAFS